RRWRASSAPPTSSRRPRAPSCCSSDRASLLHLITETIFVNVRGVSFRLVPAAAVLLTGALAGCATTPTGATSGNATTLNVVAAENFWGSLATQLGGEHVRVTSIIDNP